MPRPSTAITFQGAYPIGDTDVNALPVKELGPAIAFYTKVLGFQLVHRKETAVLKRNNATIGLARNDADPEQASVYFAVNGLNRLREEYLAVGLEPGAIRVDQHEGKSYRLFFAKEPYGVCFCFGEPA